MYFYTALEILMTKPASRIAREGWNGKGMWITLSPGGKVDAGDLWAPANSAWAEKRVHRIEVLPYVTMKTADEKIVPWMCSQTDLLADDWVHLE